MIPERKVRTLRFSDLPEEVVEEILSKLPPECLVNCKRVCKAWYVLVKDPKFVDKHLQLGLGNSEASRPMFLSWNRQELSLHEIFNEHSLDKFRNQAHSLIRISDDKEDGTDGGDRLTCVIEPLDLPPIPNRKCREDGTFVSRDFHCSGIICLAEDFYPYSETIILCNPALREIKLVPKSTCIAGFICTCLGFGYDLRAHDYKYVRILSSINVYKGPPRAQIYSLRSNTWREIKINVGVPNFSRRRCGVYFRGMYYWWTSSKYEDRGLMIAFDMCSEEFSAVPLPDVPMQSTCWKSLAVWNDSVALFFSRENSWFSTSFEMWVMAGDHCVGNESCWTQYLTIGPLAGIHAPVAFWKDDELIMETRDGLLVSYGIYTGIIRKIPFPGAVFPEKCQADIYVKSIVSVKRNMFNHW